MENFINRLRSYIEYVKKVGGYCIIEEIIKQVLIFFLLDILGFSFYDLIKVFVEFVVDFLGVKFIERVDYVFYCNG